MILNIMKFGKLTLLNKNDQLTGNSKIKFICDFRKETIKTFNNIRNGHTKLCGRYNEIGTENELRKALGYSKIWDVGKKRWVLDLMIEPT